MNLLQLEINYLHSTLSSGRMTERLRRRSREQNVPSSIPRLGISVEVTS